MNIDAYDLMSLHWMARRYADGRSSYSPGLFNGITRKLLAAGAELKTPHFARDGMGRRFDGLTDEQVADAAQDMPRGFIPDEPDERFGALYDALSEIAALPEQGGCGDGVDAVDLWMLMQKRAKAAIDAFEAGSTPAPSEQDEAERG